MPGPISFLCRRARLIRGLTQLHFAEHMGVDQVTISRWERSKQEPTPSLLTQIREIITRSEPSQSRSYIEASRLLKIVVDTEDFSRVMITSRGLLESFGMTYEEFAQRTEGDMWTDDGKRVNELVHADPRWKQGAIAFVETTHLSALGWVHTMAAPLSETGCTLWEGVLANGDHHEFSVQLTPFDTPENGSA